VLERNKNITISGKTADPPSAAILTVYLDRAQDLPVSLYPEPLLSFFQQLLFCLKSALDVGVIQYNAFLFSLKKVTRTPAPWCRFLCRIPPKRAGYGVIALIIHHM